MSSTHFDEGWGRRREHANIEAVQNLILEAVASETGLPMPPLVRNFVSGLQSAHGGGKVANEPFTRSHLRVASYMQFKGDREAKEQRIRRLINRLLEYQRKTGYLFFLIKRGGEPVGTDPQGNTIYSATSYTDFLKPVADGAVQRARASELWKRNPGDALAAQVAWALDQLPRVDEVQDEEKQPNKLALADYERQSEEQLLTSVEKRADGIAERGGDVGHWLEKLEVQISRLRRSRLKTDGALRQAAMHEAIEQREAQHRAEDAQYWGEDKATDPPTKVTPPAEVNPPTKVTPPSEINPSESEEKPDMFAAAVSHAQRGWRSFPGHWLKAEGVCSCPKGAKCDSPGKHPRISEWQKLSSTDEGWLKCWFKKQWPNANPCILTGEASGLYVVDFDFRSGGDATLGELCDRHGDGWLDTLTVRTGGGIHLYYQYPKGLDLRNTAGKIGPGVDSRANGGYVVAPPSLHVSGRRYEWANDLELTPLPDWLLKLLTEEKPVAASSGTKPRPQATGSAGISEGSRNHNLFIIGCSMRGKGKSLAEIEAELLDNNARRCSPPLPEEEVLKIARSASSYAANRVSVGA